jgi:hypothetical protein
MKNMSIKQSLLIVIFTCCLFSCKKETITKTNNAPSKVTNFTISFGSDDVYNWTDATDADGDAITYDLYLLKDTNAKPFKVAENLTTSQYTTSVSYLGITRAMIVVAKDGKGGETTSVEYPTIIL